MRSPYLIGLPSITNYSSHSYPSTSPRFVLSRISPPLLAFHFVRQKAWSCPQIDSGVADLASPHHQEESKGCCSLSVPFSLLSFPGHPASTYCFGRAAGRGKVLRSCPLPLAPKAEMAPREQKKWNFSVSFSFN